MQSRKLLPSFLIIFVLWALPVQASRTEVGETELSAAVEYDHRFKADFKDAETEFSSSAFRVRADYSYFSLGYEYLHYNWNNPEKSELSQGHADPWQDLHRINLTARKNFQLNEDWGFNLGGGIHSAFEEELDESFGARADFSFIRYFGGGWSAGIGAAGFYHPVKSRLFPSVSIRHYPDKFPGLGLNIGFPEASLEYFFSQATSVKAFAGLNSRTYRLKDKSPVSPEGYFRDQSIKTGLSVKTAVGGRLMVKLSAYLLLDRKIRIYDHHKSKIQDFRIENSPGASLSLEYKF